MNYYLKWSLIVASYKQLSKYNWQVVISLGYDENGKKRRVKKQGFRTKKEAEVFVTETLTKKNHGYIAPTNTNILFKDFITQWFNDYKSLSIGINTRTNYLSRINTHIIPKLGHYKLTDITNNIIQNFYNDLINKEKLNPSSAKKILETLNNCFKYAQKNKLIYTVPTEIETIKINKKEIEFWTENELKFFLEEIKDTYLYTPILIASMTGVRVGELCGIRWCDIDLENGYININNQVIQDKNSKKLILSSILKTSTSKRSISIPKLLITHLEGIKAQINPNKLDCIILNRQNEICNPRNISMEFTKKVDKYPNINQISIHSLRHTHATLLILNGENIKVISDRLGHKDISVTLNTYTHVMEDMKKDTAKLLDSLFNNSTNLY